MIGGSPGGLDSGRQGVVINEVLAHTDAPLSDSIELYNPTNDAIDVGGWFLSDDGSTPQKYRIAAGTTIAPGGYLVFNESDFNPALPNATSLQPFALSGSRGDSVWLFAGDGTEVFGFEDHVSFDATFNGMSLGRIEGSGGRLVPLANRSLGWINGMFQSASLGISEINFHPSAPTVAALAIEPTLTEQDLEFVEVTNTTGTPISLDDWRLWGEIEFDFAPTAALAAGAAVAVVSFDPDDPMHTQRAEAFRSQYGIDSSVWLAGPFFRFVEQ